MREKLVLSHLIESKVKGKVFDFRSIWQRQSISQATEQQIISLAHAILKIIVNTPSGIQNVTEWCKKEQCWNSAKDIEFTILPEFYSELVDEEEDRTLLRDGRTQQSIDKGIEAQKEVLNLRADYWLQLKSWGLGKRLISLQENRLMEIAINLPNMLPSEHQSAKLLKISERLKLEGFRYP